MAARGGIESGPGAVCRVEPSETATRTAESAGPRRSRLRSGRRLPLRYRDVGWRRALVPGTAEPGIVEPLAQIAIIDLAQPHRRDLAEAEERQGRHGMNGEASRDLGQAVDIDADDLEVPVAQLLPRHAEEPGLDPPRRRAPHRAA